MSNESPWPTLGQLLAHSEEELSKVDPLVMNLVVAKGIPNLAELDIGRYAKMADEWADELRGYLPAADANFYNRPHLWQNDLDFSRLALMCWYVGKQLGARYREDQQSIQRVRYTNPNDLFLSGVMETRQGTCGNMATLHIALGWRLDWPVSLACVGSHFICRFDDSRKTFNIEATFYGENGGFSSATDEQYLTANHLPHKAVECGSDLRAVTPREMLGLFVGLRARHLENTDRMGEAEPDYLLARYLFPRNRQLYFRQNQISVQCSMELFEPGENGHPTGLAAWLREVVAVAPWKRKRNSNTQEKTNVRPAHPYFQQINVGANL